jgi:hypothetical protein
MVLMNVSDFEDLLRKSSLPHGSDEPFGERTPSLKKGGESG